MNDNISNPMGLQRVSHPPKSERKRKYDGVLRQAIEEAYADLNKKAINFAANNPDVTTRGNHNHILDGPWLMLPEVYKTRMAGRHLKKSYADYRGPQQEAVIWETRRIRADDHEALSDQPGGGDEYVYRVFVKAVGVEHELHPDSAR